MPISTATDCFLLFSFCGRHLPLQPSSPSSPTLAPPSIRPLRSSLTRLLHQDYHTPPPTPAPPSRAHTTPAHHARSLLRPIASASSSSENGFPGVTPLPTGAALVAARAGSSPPVVGAGAPFGRAVSLAWMLEAVGSATFTTVSCWGLTFPNFCSMEDGVGGVKRGAYHPPHHLSPQPPSRPRPCHSSAAGPLRRIDCSCDSVRGFPWVSTRSVRFGAGRWS